MHPASIMRQEGSSAAFNWRDLTVIVLVIAILILVGAGAAHDRPTFAWRSTSYIALPCSIAQLCTAHDDAC